MTLFFFVLILIALTAFVIGQLFLKRAMQFSRIHGFANARFFVRLAPGIFSMTVSFFLTLGLLQHFDLSYLYPFQGLSIMIIAISAALTLKEKLTFRLMAGTLCITAGVVLVSLS